MAAIRGAEPVASFLPVPASADRSLSSLLALSLARAGGRRIVSVVTVVLLLAAGGMFAFPAFTDLFQRYQQAHVVNKFGQPRFQTEYRLGRVKVGEGLTKLVINNNRVHVNVLVVEGTTLAALEAGAGHYVDTPYPCEPGNVGIAGHRTTYGRPFNKLNYMKAGDAIDLYTPFAKCTYKVVPPFGGHGNPFVVRPNDFSVVSQDNLPPDAHWLTLTSCNPLGSDAQRIVLRAKLVKTVPLPSTKASH
ncbi:MAG: class E sortase [Frankiales bacterium]|nr:class E sortase [Frankiales bacterium]